MPQQQAQRVRSPRRAAGTACRLETAGDRPAHASTIRPCWNCQANNSEWDGPPADRKAAVSGSTAGDRSALDAARDACRPMRDESQIESVTETKSSLGPKFLCSPSRRPRLYDGPGRLRRDAISLYQNRRVLSPVESADSAPGPDQSGGRDKHRPSPKQQRGKNPSITEMRTLRGRLHH